MTCWLFSLYNHSVNTLQFYYADRVLGLSSLIKPRNIRDSYRLHPSKSRRADFLFFCEQMKTKEDKALIQKIASAMELSEYFILEILNPQNPHTPFILNNFLARFRPKGFAVFGPELAARLRGRPNSSTSGTPKQVSAEEGKEGRPNSSAPGLFKQEVALSENLSLSIPGCVLDKVSAFTGPDSPDLRKRKQSAWKILKRVL